jgi:GT2 family glycosyltransferase
VSGHAGLSAGSRRVLSDPGTRMGSNGLRTGPLSLPAMPESATLSNVSDETHADCVTISLVTHNGMRWLPGCWTTLGEQTRPWHRLLIVDNASTDGSQAWLRERASNDPRIELTLSDVNLGFARGHNLNLRRSPCSAALVLNQDVELDPDYIAVAIQTLKEHPAVAAVQGRLLRLDGPGQRTTIIDTTGLEMHRDRRLTSRGHGHEDGPDYATAGPVFGADGPAPVYRRSALLDAQLPCTAGGWEVFDEDFYMYTEDLDLAWRLSRLGWSTRYEPSAVAWHARAVRGPRSRSALEIARVNRAHSSLVSFWSWRNQRLMQVKNDPLGPFLRDLPWIAFRDLIELGFIAAVDPGRLRAMPSLLRVLPSAMRKRMALERRLRGAANRRRSPEGTR